MPTLPLETPRSARPLLKWAGGKRQLLPLLRLHYPGQFDRYIEPFFGSGAVFFDLYSQGRLDGRTAWLLDDNPDLTGCYTALRDHTEQVIAALGVMAEEHRTRGNDLYYEIRDGRFNPSRAAGDAYTPQLAAMLIYLNRTGFNGLFRLNRRGEFNVPAGRYDNPRICDPQHLRHVAAALRANGLRLERGSFERSLDEAGKGDFVYCDPPYAPLTRTSRFAQYTSAGFGAEDQERLQQAILGAVRRGAVVLLSNSSAPEVERLYGGVAARETGLVLRRVPARRAINSRAALRGPVNEILVTNAPARLTDLAIRPRPIAARLRAKLKTA